MPNRELFEQRYIMPSASRGKHGSAPDYTTAND
jgi:hypothetical protein